LLVVGLLHVSIVMSHRSGRIHASPTYCPLMHYYWRSVLSIGPEDWVALQGLPNVHQSNILAFRGAKSRVAEVVVGNGVSEEVRRRRRRRCCCCVSGRRDDRLARHCLSSTIATERVHRLNCATQLSLPLPLPLPLSLLSVSVSVSLSLTHPLSLARSLSLSSRPLPPARPP
jgi:hypothetical protein